MSDVKIKQKMANLNSALQRLQEICNESLDPKNYLVDATIQRFEFSFELFWKTLKILLEKEGVLATTPKEILQAAYRIGWINDEKIWLSMLMDRNNTSHVYSQKIALEIYYRIKTYSPLLTDVFTELAEKFHI